MTDKQALLIETLRYSVPYINTYQGKTFVILLTDIAIENPAYPTIINDLGLLHSLGIKLVIVYGVRTQIDRALVRENIMPLYHNSIRITTKEMLRVIKQTAGLLQFDITSRLSMSLRKTPLAGAQIPVVSGNFVMARPLGIYEGIDYYHTGTIRRINCDRILHQLNNNNIVLIGPIAVSVTGESFNLSSGHIAGEIAIAIKADKLISFWDVEQKTILSKLGTSELQPDEVDSLTKGNTDNISPHSSDWQLLQMAAKSARNGGVPCHLINYHSNGALLQELFLHHRAGIHITTPHTEHIRPATINDVAGILQLIQPLEKEGALIHRSPAQLQENISKFFVIERDNRLIGCALLHPYPAEKKGEMACVAIHPDYRNSSRGDLLLQKIIKIARKQQLDSLFVLTTQSLHWFLERGFVVAHITDLPLDKQAAYNYKRNSKVLILTLN